MNLLARAAAEVVSPLAGRAILFLAEDLAPYYKTSDGVVHPLVGPQGIQGEKGDQGLQGLQGVQGETGPQGVGVPSGGATGQFVQRTASGTQWAGALTPGQMGFAADSIQVANNISTLNNATQSGFYRAAAGSEGNPTPTGAFLCIHLPSGGTATYGAQFGISEADGRIYQRLKTNGAWGGWIPSAFDRQVVHSTGNESVAGEKHWLNIATWDVQTAGSIQYATPAALPGIIIRNGDPSGPTSAMWRTDIRAGAGFCNIVVNDVVGDGTGGARGISLQQAAVRPTSDNVLSNGASGFRWREIWSVNATINPSDARLKTDPRQLRDAEFKAASAIARLPSVWRWLNRVNGDENCEPEGKGARKHFGPTVQAAIAVMESFGLDPFAYSFICYDEWDAEPEQWHGWPAKEAVLDEDGNELEPAVEAGRELIQPAREAGNRYSFRREELLCFIVRALAQEIDGLSERVAELCLARIEQRLMVLESRPAAEP
ncbi:TPA: hypothetical protein ACKQDF_000788 [Stenotrophomonas maltophilia]